MQEFSVRTRSRAQLVDITDEVRAAVRETGISDGVATVFAPHTTAAITINENADPSVCRDLLAKLDRLAPRDEAFYTHAEGNADAHVKSSLVGCAQAVLVRGGDLALGTWQGVYFAEFDGPRTRRVWVSVSG